MRVDQAIYGTVKHGHALRCASGDLKFASDIAQRLDLPDTEPQGAVWSPVTSGFPASDRYVIARTFSDPSAGRSGMVVTHALICELEEICGVDDLRPLLTHLITSFDAAPAAVEPLEFTPTPGFPPLTADLADTAHALVVRGTGPVVRIGSDGFEDLMVALWGGLWQALRRKLYFRLSFGPKDVVEKPEPTIVCTPVALVGRWPQQQRVVGRSGADRPRAAKMIDGTTDGIEMREFGKKIGAILEDFRELQLLEQAHNMTFAKPDTPARLTSVARLIERLSPDPKHGDVEKRIIVERLVNVLPAARPSEILALRNLSLRSFGTSDLIWRELESWFVRNQYDSSDDAEIISILADALIEEEAIAPWREAVSRGLKSAAAVLDSRFAAGFWRWAKSDPRVVPLVIGLIERDRKGLSEIEDAAPSVLDRVTGESVMAYAAKHKLFRLHAIAASAYMKPSDAAIAQSIVEPGVDPTSMRLAIRRATASEILDAVACVPDGRVLMIAAESVAKDPTLLARRDMSTAPNRRVWAAALKTEPDAWRGPEDPRGAFEKLLDEQLEGGLPPPELIDLLSGSPLANLTAYPRRGEIWTKLPPRVRDRLLASTIDAWFTSSANTTGNNAIEPELAQAIIRDPRLDPFLARFTDGTIAERLNVIDRLGGLDHGRFRRWVSTAIHAVRPLTTSDADLLGRALAMRGQRDIVQDLIPVYRSGRSDLAPILRHCLDLVGFIDRWTLGLSHISTTQKWDVLAELAAELFPSGPDQDSLWERSGGRDADLRTNGTGKERWRHAIRDIQNGRKPSASILIRQMLVDFPDNSNLRMMVNDPLFGN